MEVGIATIGGYEEVGHQMTAIYAGDDVVVFDMGLDLSQILIHDNAETKKMHNLDLTDMGAIPDDRVMSDLKGDVRAVIPMYGHLDHIDTISKLAHRYGVPVVATPFTVELVKQQIEGENKSNASNDPVKVETGETMSVDDSDNVGLEFVHVIYSIIDVINPVAHMLEDTVVYGLDKRMDRLPVLEDPVDMKHSREIGREGSNILAYIEDCMNAGRKGHMPSESAVRRHLKDVMTPAEDYDGGIITTMLPSHVSRTFLLIEFTKGISCQLILLGRSMERYSGTAGRLGSVDLLDDLGMYGHCKPVDRTSKRIVKEDKENYLPIATGHRDRPHVMLTRMGRSETPYEIDDGDKAIFSARVILESMSEGQCYQSERLLRMQGVRIYDEIYVSSHLREEGHCEMLQVFQPQHVIPAHQNLRGLASHVDLAENQGYALGCDLHVMQNGGTIQLME